MRVCNFMRVRKDADAMNHQARGVSPTGKRGKDGLKGNPWR